MFDHVKTWLTHSLARTHALGLGATSLGRRVKLRLAWPPRDGGSSAALYCPISPEADISGQAVDRRGGRRRVKKHPGSPRVETHKSGTSDGASVRPAPVRSQLGRNFSIPTRPRAQLRVSLGGISWVEGAHQHKPRADTEDHSILLKTDTARARGQPTNQSAADTTPRHPIRKQDTRARARAQ